MAAIRSVRRRRLAVAILLLAVAALTAMPLFPVLTVADGETGARLLTIPVSHGERVTLC